jgi:hypothetical protein
MTPSSVIGYPGYSGLLQAEQQNQNCFGTLGSWFSLGGVNFSSANPSVATIDSGGFMTAIAPGSTTLFGSWTGTVHYSAGPSGCQTTYVNANPGASCNVEPPCAYPVNFRQTSVTELPNGVLQFQYAWDSNTGNIADLSNCFVGEIVTYPDGDPFNWPSPPYASNSGNDNPEIREVNGNLGGSPDTHGHKLFQTPYTFNTFTATQYYRYKCPCKNGGAYVNLMGPIEIIRTVQFVPFPAWTYQIKKSGSLAHVTLP